MATHTTNPSISQIYSNATYDTVLNYSVVAADKPSQTVKPVKSLFEVFRCAIYLNLLSIVDAIFRQFLTSTFTSMDDETLRRLAVEALTEEAKLGAKRAEVMGPTGWVKPRECINKRFLHSTLCNVVLSNKHRFKERNKSIEKHLYKLESVKKS